MPLINLVSIVHLVLLCMWGGVVATEAVLELYPFREKGLHPATVRMHYWIDLLVELPLIVGVVISGTVLVFLAWPLSIWHVLKIVCAGVAVEMNLVCIVMVIRRKQALEAGNDEAGQWRTSKRIVLMAAVGISLAAVAAGLGFWLAHQRLVALFG